MNQYNMFLIFINPYEGAAYKSMFMIINIIRGCLIFINHSYAAKPKFLHVFLNIHKDFAWRCSTSPKWATPSHNPPSDSLLFKKKYWLVVSTRLKKISQSVGIIPNIINYDNLS